MRQWPVIIVVAIVLIGLAIWGLDRSGTPAQPSQATTTPDIISGVANATYTNSDLGFSIQYPSTATSSSYDFSGFLPVTQTSLVSFVLPSSMSAGTNLGEAGVYIGATTTPAIVAVCTSPSIQQGESAAGTATINGTTFAIATSTGVGAGNIYEEKVYRTVQNDSCLEIVEMLHSGNIENYPTGTVTQFNHDEFSGILDAIVQTYQPL